MRNDISQRAKTTIGVVSLAAGFGASTLVGGFGAALAQGITNPIMRGFGYLGAWGLGVTAGVAVSETVSETLTANYFAAKDLVRTH